MTEILRQATFGVMGCPVTFLNWHPGAPNDVNDVENCAEMYPPDTWWNDTKCTNLNRYICKQPLGKVYIVNRKYMDRVAVILSSCQLA